MNIQSFYEYIILRDILAFILPGGISFAGIYMIVHAIGFDRLEKTIPYLSNLSTFLATILILLVSFLIGHVWDWAYRIKFQTKKPFQRIAIIKKILMGDKTSGPNSVDNHIANEIKTAVGQFLNIDWEKTPIEQWIKSGKAYEVSVLLAYWIEEEDPKLFGAEVGRPIVQGHFLHVCGLALYFFSLCVGITGIIGGILYWTGINNILIFDPWMLILLIFFSYIFGMLLIKQGIHKRDVIMEHAFRVFYVLWRKRVLDQEANLKKGQNYKLIKKRNRI